MNAFALHDVSDQAAVRRWGASAFAIVAAHAALIALGLELVHAAAGARRLAACDHGRHGAGFLRAAADARWISRRDPVMQQADASPPEPAAAEAVQEQIAPTPPQEKPEVVAPPEQKAEPTPPKPEPAKAGPGAKAVAGQSRKWFAPTPRSRPTRRRRRERQPRPEPSARRRPRPPSAPAHRRRRLPSYRQMVAPICNASSSTRPPPRPRASRAPRGSASRSAERCGAFRRPRRLVRPFGAGCRDAGDGAPRPAVSRVSARM